MQSAVWSVKVLEFPLSLKKEDLYSKVECRHVTFITVT